jgi:hypothetical protein
MRETIETVATHTMKATRIHNFGGPEVLQYEDATEDENHERRNRTSPFCTHIVWSSAM